MSTNQGPRIGITLGDCAGIGPEIVDLALKSGRVPDSAEYVVIGREPDCNPGAPTIETARAAAAALEEAVIRARRGELQAIVTGPIHKARMYDAGFKFPGLNPHAGESGKIGREEIEIIAPAVSELQSAVINKGTSGSDKLAIFSGP